MKVRELKDLLNAECLTPEADLEAEISCGYSCDLLSWVLAHGKAGMAWCTVQTHMNVIAVSVLMEMACVILVEGVEIEEPTTGLYIKRVLYSDGTVKTSTIMGK